jgi:hypothetical protein
MALTSGSFEINIRKFDGTNFNFWKEQMQDYRIVRGSIDPIEHDPAPATYKPDVWMKLDWVARATIQMHLLESVYYMVQSCTTTKELVAAVGHIRKEGGRYKDLLNTAPLQLTDERI